MAALSDRKYFKFNKNRLFGSKYEKNDQKAIF